MDPLWLKYAHLLGAILIFGTGLGTAFHMWCAHRTGRPEVVAAVGRSTVLADWLFTAPWVVLQPVTGALLIRAHGWSPLEPWIAWSLGLYALAGACWLPVVWLQARDEAPGHRRGARGRAGAAHPLSPPRQGVVRPRLAGLHRHVHHRPPDGL
jgi:uncharacterized membrane protein